VEMVLRKPTRCSYLRVTLSPEKRKEEVLWERSDLVRMRSWQY
jgi:hypothetical protein